LFLIPLLQTAHDFVKRERRLAGAGDRRIIFCLLRRFGPSAKQQRHAN
jgi:hypothetical protein